MSEESIVLLRTALQAADIGARAEPLKSGALRRALEELLRAGKEQGWIISGRGKKSDWTPPASLQQNDLIEVEHARRNKEIEIVRGRFLNWHKPTNRARIIVQRKTGPQVVLGKFVAIIPEEGEEG